MREFERAAHDLLAQYEAAPSRVVSLAETRKQVGILSLKQTELLEEALRAMEHGLYRPAIVMSWAAFMDFIQERLAEDGFRPLHARYPKWTRWSSLDELREGITEFAMLEAARELGYLTKADLKAAQGMLSLRNECAHPSGYKPSLNEALGYVSQMLNRIPTIAQRQLKAP